MKCFNHPEIDAIGLCTACNRGLCVDCVVDLERGLACKDRCEHEVRRLLDLRDYSFTQPHQQETKVRQMSAGRARAVLINVVLAIIFFVTWYIYGQIIFAIVAGMNCLLAILAAVTGRSRIRTDQFRLCPKCGYNVTGNTSGRCPECGYLI